MRHHTAECGAAARKMAEICCVPVTKQAISAVMQGHFTIQAGDLSSGLETFPGRSEGNLTGIRIEWPVFGHPESVPESERRRSLMQDADSPVAGQETRQNTRNSPRNGQPTAQGRKKRRRTQSDGSPDGAAG